MIRQDEGEDGLLNSVCMILWWSIDELSSLPEASDQAKEPFGEAGFGWDCVGSK